MYKILKNKEKLGAMPSSPAFFKGEIQK